MKILPVLIVRLRFRQTRGDPLIQGRGVLVEGGSVEREKIDLKTDDLTEG